MENNEKLLLDRQRMRQLLGKLADIYPQSLVEPELADIKDNAAQRILFYLHGHGLIEGDCHRTFFSAAKITAKGLDFLADDGGLSAILGVVTVKLHDETLKRLISTKIQESDLPDEKKRAWRAALENMSAHGMQHLITKLIDIGIENTPKLVSLLSRFFN